jgi:uncharacterized membrane protein
MRRMVIAAISLVGLFVAMYLWLYKLGVLGSLSCGVGDCETVNTSKWATLMGQPVALWGVCFYVALLTVAVLGTLERFERDRRIAVALTVMTGGGVLFSGWLTYLELAVIHAICQWCVVSAVLVLGMFALSVAELKASSQER